MNVTNKRSLAYRFVTASGWILGEHGLGQLMRFVGNLILTRLLAPEMFGIMAVAHVFILGMRMFSDLGLDLIIIRSNRGNDCRFLNSVWTLQVIRGVILWSLTVSLAYFCYSLSSGDFWAADSVYRNLELPWVIALLSLSPLIDGFKSTNVATANRNLEMRSVAGIQVGSQIAGTSLMIIMAIVNPSIYALVVGGLFSNLVFVMSSHYFIVGQKNRFIWDIDAFREIFGFGKWIFLTSILGFLLASGDKLLLAALTDPVNLGLYSLAMALVSIVLGISNKIVGKIGYAAISEVGRDTPKRVKEIYYRVRFPLDAGLLFISGAIFMTGSMLVSLLYDARYEYAGHIIQVLALSLIFDRYSLFSRALSALGRPELNVGINIIGIISLYVGVPMCFSKFGFEGAIWFIACNRFFTLPLIFYYKQKFGLCDYKNEVKGFLFFFLGSFLGWLLLVVVS